MKQKERFDEKPKQEHTEPVHHRKCFGRHGTYKIGRRTDSEIGGDSSCGDYRF